MQCDSDRSNPAANAPGINGASAFQLSATVNDGELAAQDSNSQETARYQRDQANEGGNGKGGAYNHLSYMLHTLDMNLSDIIQARVKKANPTYKMEWAGSMFSLELACLWMAAQNGFRTM